MINEALSLRAKRSNLSNCLMHSGDCFVTVFLAMTAGSIDPDELDFN
jgi:hypothetical protein